VTPIEFGVTSHVHLIFRSAKEEEKPEQLLGDFKRFTSKAIITAIKANPRESRKEFLLEKFQKAGSMSSNVTNYQFWRYDNKPIELWSNRAAAGVNGQSSVTISREA
jgi:hypothetical protein